MKQKQGKRNWVYCIDGIPITRENAYRLKNHVGCWHWKGANCDCKCHKKKVSKL